MEKLVGYTSSDYSNIIRSIILKDSCYQNLIESANLGILRLLAKEDLDLLLIISEPRAIP